MSAAIPRFGTDGIRGPAGAWPIDAAGARLLGRALAAWTGGGTVLVGGDTRRSTPALLAAAAEGIASGGGRALDCGVLPTPALSCAVPALGAAAGLMVTASHNPAADNGFKVLGPDGGKVGDETGLGEALRRAAVGDVSAANGEIGRLHDAAAAWRARLPSPDLRGLRILFDAAHGAAAPHGPAILRALGADLRLRGCAPDGDNINDGCGALHPPIDLGDAAVAIALDGDGDRLVMVTPARGLLDGDDLLWLLAGEDPLRRPVVGTVMTNGGLEQALGGRLVRTPVGDRHVSLAMARTGAVAGGEPSGHLLLAGGPPTACGLYAALKVLEHGIPAAPGWERWPQARRDLRVGALPAALASVAAAERAAHRVVVRYSGTEPVVRVMVEGRDATTWADRIAAEINTCLAASV